MMLDHPKMTESTSVVLGEPCLHLQLPFANRSGLHVSDARIRALKPDDQCCEALLAWMGYGLLFYPSG
jgi:hypothetical protein